MKQVVMGTVIKADFGERQELTIVLEKMVDIHVGDRIVLTMRN